MKLCLITTFPPSRGDLNEYGFHLATSTQAAPNVQLTVLADQIHRAETLPHFRVERCWRFNSWFNLIYILRAVRRLDPDVVWFNMGFATFARNPVAAFLSTIAPALLRFAGYYTHITLHTLFESTDLKKAGVRFPALYRLAGRIATRLLLLSNDVSVLLPSFRDLLVTRYGADPKRIQFRPHGIFNLPSSSPRSTRSERVILAFGYWGTYKRLELLLSAMKEVSTEVPEAKLVIAGTNHPSAPGYLESVQDRLRGSGLQIRFTGYVPEAELAELFATAEVLVMPYTTAAGCSGVMHQACEYGLPIVAADIAEIREVAREEGVAALFYDTEQESSLARQLTDLLRSETLRRSLSEQNLSVAERLPISQVVQSYLEHFELRTSKDHRITRRVQQDAA